MYSTSSDQTRALIQVPMILNNAEQILVGQVLVWLFKRWLGKEKPKDEEIVVAPEPVVEEDEKSYK